MKTILPALFAACIIFSSCGKKDNTTPDPDPNPTNPVDVDSMRYSVNGLTDITLKRKDSTIVPIGIAHLGGRQEKLELSLTGLPATVTGVLGTTSGIPAFGTTLTLKTAKTAANTYPLTIVAKTASGKEQKFTINLKVTGDENFCIESFVGNYHYENCNSGVLSETTAVKSVSGNRVSISLFPSFAVEAIVDCDNDKITIPDTIIGGGVYEVRGSGIIVNSDEFELYYYIKNHFSGEESNRQSTYMRQ